ncbi:MAG: polysaccharide pyruvyl transferase CsaB [Clostridiales bacterium]|nr:polysaccharide pyruvyl transferase CsaB [Clostridiales bacterium]
MKTKNILISGYYGFGNTGDEAVLAAMIEQLDAVMPGVKITVLSGDPGETAAAFGVTAVNRWRPWEIIRAMRRCDIFISGGGSLLQDATSARSMNYYLFLMLLARLLRRKVFVYAQGVGPLIRKRSRKRAAFVLRRCHRVTLRDEDSARLLLSLGVPAEKIFITADPVLSMIPRGSLPPLPEGRKMAFCLRSWKGLDIPAVAAAADHYAEQGWQIVFLPFAGERDLHVCRQAAALMRWEFLILSEVAPPQMMTAVCACRFVVGMRLHSLIMAAAGAVPFAGLAYDPKIRSFCSDVRQPALELEDLADGFLAAKIEAALAKSGESRAYLQGRRAEWRRLCRLNAEMLRDCLLSRS